MAKQCGPYFITGCRDNLCFYKMEGRYYARTKSSLTRKRVMNDPAFACTMQYAQLFGAASTIASVVYRQLSKEEKIKGQYRQLTGQAMRLLKKGKPISMVQHLLAVHYSGKPINKLNQKKKVIKRNERTAFADVLLACIFATEEPIDAGIIISPKAIAPT